MSGNDVASLHPNAGCNKAWSLRRVKIITILWGDDNDNFSADGEIDFKLTDRFDFCFCHKIDAIQSHRNQNHFLFAHRIALHPYAQDRLWRLCSKIYIRKHVLLILTSKDLIDSTESALPYKPPTQRVCAIHGTDYGAERWYQKKRNSVTVVE